MYIYMFYGTTVTRAPRLAASVYKRIYMHVLILLHLAPGQRGAHLLFSGLFVRAWHVYASKPEATTSEGARGPTAPSKSVNKRADSAV